MSPVINIKHKITLYLLLAVYAFALVRPILPVVTDVVAHTFFKMQHIATVHVENGKYHVHIELEKASEKPATKNPTDVSAFSETLSNHLQNNTLTIPFIYPAIIQKKAFTYIDFPVDSCIKSPTPPPKA